MTYLRGIDPPEGDDPRHEAAVDELQMRRAMRAIRQEREAADRLYPRPPHRDVKATPARPPVNPTDPEGDAA